MTLVELEAWSSRVCELTHPQAAAMAGTGLVEVTTEREPGRWRVSAGRWVGVATDPSWEIRVQPRIQVPHLLFLLGYATDPRGWRDERAGFEAADVLFVAVAEGFSRQALRLLDEGLIYGYVEVEERLTNLRGRIRFSEQVARSALPLPVEVTYDNYTIDVAENRMLKSATLALLQLPRVSELARRRLLKLRAALDEVTFEPRPQDMALPEPTRLNERYMPVLRLAQLILRSASIAAPRGSVTSVSYAFDMDKVFEDFLSVALREALAPLGGEVRFQWERRLDEGSRIRIRPDIAWLQAGRPRAVVDAKHKMLATAGVPNEDVYQVLAYCTALGLERGYLVYAKEVGEEPIDLAVRNSACEIRVRSVDIGDDPDALLGQVSALAEEIADQ